MRKTLVWCAVVIAIACMPAAAMAQTEQDADEGVLVRVGGDASVSPAETVGLAVVVQGDLVVEGTARTVIVVGGTATVVGASVDALIVVNGEAAIGDGTVITGDVWLANSSLELSDLAQIDGEIRRNFEGAFLAGLWVFGIILALGLAVTAILLVLGFAAIAPDLARRAGTVIRTEFGQVVIAGLILWIALPIAAGLVAVTIVGLPAAFTIWFAVLPIVAIVGWLVAAVWLGELLVARGGGVGHPYLAAFLGALVLVVAGLIPFVGWLVGWLAGLLGGSALALLAWRSFRTASAREQGA